MLQSSLKIFRVILGINFLKVPDSTCIPAKSSNRALLHFFFLTGFHRIILKIASTLASSYLLDPLSYYGNIDGFPNANSTSRLTSNQRRLNSQYIERPYLFTWRKQIAANAGNDVHKRNPYTFLIGSALVQPLRKSIWGWEERIKGETGKELINVWTSFAPHFQGSIPLGGNTITASFIFQNENYFWVRSWLQLQKVINSKLWISNWKAEIHVLKEHEF